MRAVLAVIVPVLCHLIDAPAVLFEQTRGELGCVLLGLIELFTARFGITNFNMDALHVALAVPVAACPRVAVFRDALHNVYIVHRVVKRDLKVVIPHVGDLICGGRIVRRVVDDNARRCAGVRAFNGIFVLWHKIFSDRYHSSSLRFYAPDFDLAALCAKAQRGLDIIGIAVFQSHFMCHVRLPFRSRCFSGEKVID